MPSNRENAPRRASTQRHRPIFSTRAAATDDLRLAPTDSVTEDAHLRFGLDTRPSPYEPATSSSRPVPRQHARTQKVRDALFRWWQGPVDRGAGEDASRRTVQASPARREHVDLKGIRQLPKPTNNDDSQKLGTISGVFVPTTLNVLSILMFLRFGFILGQSGVIGMIGIHLGFLLV
jgi:solute carrier family 12 (potassium/chloride transporters), member 9